MGNTSGFSLSSEFLKIQEDIILFKDTVYDNKNHIKDVINQFDFQDKHYPAFNISAVIKVESESELDNHFKYLQIILSLYKLGSIHLSGILYKKTLLTKGYMQELRDSEFDVSHNYKITKKEEITFQNFVKSFMAIFTNHYH